MSWWEGMNFSIGSQEKKIRIKEALDDAEIFIEEIRDKEEVTEDHKELKTRLEIILDEEEDKLDKSEISTIENFVNHYEALFEDRTIEEMFEDAIDQKCGFFGNHQAEIERYYPEKFNKKLPKNGGWIMVKLLPGVAKEAQPHLFGVYYAKAAPAKVRIVLGDGILGKGRARDYNYYKVKIVTEAGELHLWPHEYVIISHIEDVLDGIGTEFEMIKLGGDTNYDVAKIHYLGTRGISQTDVYQMLMGSINALDFAYFKLISQDYIDYYQFSFDCLDRGISAYMIPRLWHSKQTGEPLFKVTRVDRKEFKDDTDKAESSKDKEEGNPKKDKPKSKQRSSSGGTGKKR